MANVFRTIAVPLSQHAKAVAISDALGYPDKGSFIGKIALSGVEPSSGPDNRQMAGYLCSGIFDSGSRLLGTAADLFAALNGAPGITQADCDAYVASREVTQAPPIPHREAIARECNGTELTTVWTQPQGAHDAYPATAAVAHGGKKWRSLVASNVWEPGVSGWREFWSVGYPAWIQPTGSHDAYPVGARVRHVSKNWQSTASANVWEPGVFGWVEV